MIILIILINNFNTQHNPEVKRKSLKSDVKCVEHESCGCPEPRCAIAVAVVAEPN